MFLIKFLKLKNNYFAIFDKIIELLILKKKFTYLASIGKVPHKKPVPTFHYQ